jgi:ELWxxDGT repeat protein
MLFVATSATSGKELWISDGTAQGTKLLKDIEPGPDSSEPMSLVRAGGLVFFHARTSANGRELWVSDGTDVGTHQVADLYPGTGSAFRADRQPRSLLKVQGRRVWFTATDSAATPCALYFSDGSAAGTRCALNAVDNLIYTNELLTLSNGAVAFAAWRSTDGEEVRVVRNGQLLSLPGGDVRAGLGSAGPRELVATPRGMVYFSADDGNTGRELWKLDLSDFIFTDGLE